MLPSVGSPTTLPVECSLQPDDAPKPFSFKNRPKSKPRRVIENNETTYDEEDKSDPGNNPSEPKRQTSAEKKMSDKKLITPSRLRSFTRRSPTTRSREVRRKEASLETAVMVDVATYTGDDLTRCDAAQNKCFVFEDVHDDEEFRKSYKIVSSDLSLKQFDVMNDKSIVHTYENMLHTTLCQNDYPYHTNIDKLPDKVPMTWRRQEWDVTLQNVKVLKEDVLAFSRISIYYVNIYMVLR